MSNAFTALALGSAAIARHVCMLTRMALMAESLTVIVCSPIASVNAHTCQLTSNWQGEHYRCSGINTTSGWSAAMSAATSFASW